MEYTPIQEKRIINNITKVFKNRDANLLSKESYNFITLKMGFIAHFSLYGFRDCYRDLRDFCLRLQTSEYSNDKDYYSRDRYDLNEQEKRIMISIVEIAKQYEQEIDAVFNEIEKKQDVSTIKALMGKHNLNASELK